jgi:hypothetical protein
VAAPRWDPEGGREAVVRAIAEADSLIGCAGALGTSVGTLRAYCGREGIDITPARSRGGRTCAPWYPDPRDWERELAVAVSISDLAQRLGVAPRTVRLYAERNGIDISAVRAPGGNPSTARSRTLDPGERIEQDIGRQRIKGERDHYKRLYEEAVTQIRAQDDICEAVAERCAEPRPRPVFKRRRARAHLPEREAVLLLSDWQLGELVSEVETGGVNAYSWAVAERRAARLVDAVTGSLEHQMRGYQVSRLVIAVLGDIVEGHDVFNGQPWSLDKDAAMQTLDGSELLAGVICALCEAVAPHGVTVDVYAVPGNHGKPGGRAGGQTPVTFNFDHLLYRMLEKELRNQPVREFAIEPAGRLLFEAAGHVFLMTHGNEVRGWGGFPFYGLDKTHARLTMELETLFKFWLLGHWHADATLPAGRGKRIVNGTMVGANQLTQSAVLTTSDPCQLLLYVSEDLGLAEEAYMVLDAEKRAAPHIYGSAA